jgi:TnpA family transposase
MIFWTVLRFGPPPFHRVGLAPPQVKQTSFYDAGLQLNRGEHRQSLAKWLFFANQGEFREGDYEEIMNKASCLSLISNAVLVWNTIQIQCDL